MDTLYVPVILEALVIGEKSGYLADLAPDYSALDYMPFGRYTQRLFGKRSEMPGIHLHWTMPDALLHGVHNGKDSIDFPELPNRWIIQRVCSKEDTIERKAWIVESDFVTNNPEVSFDEYKRITIPTFVMKDGLWTGAGSEGQIYGYMGNAREYGTPLSERGYYLENLTAVGMGDLTFAAFYYKSRSVFGFYDNMKDADNGLYTYTIAGYYGDSEKDPLVNADIDILNELKWTYNDSSAFPKRTVCHSMIKQVCWEGPQKNYGSGAPQGNIDVYVGNTSSEALAAILQDKMPEIKGFERILDIVQNDLLEGMDSIGNADSLIEAEHLLHAKQFSSEEQGIVYKIKNANDSISGQQLSTDLYEKIDKINMLQEEINIKEHEMESIKNEIYFAWWKYVLIKKDPWGGDDLNGVSSADFLELIRQFLDELEDCNNTIKENKSKIDELKGSVNDISPDHNVEIYAEHKDDFYLADSPVLMLCGDGVKRSYKQGFQNDCDDGSLYCRTNTVTGINVIINNSEVSLTLNDIEQIVSPLKGQLPDFINDIFMESIVMTEDCAESIAYKAYDKIKEKFSQEQLNAVIGQIKDHQKNKSGFNGSLPGDISQSDWSQPWNPLFMEWRVRIDPARTDINDDNSFNKFELSEIDLEYNANYNSQENAESIEIEGSTMISPHAVENMGNMMKRLADIGEIKGLDYDNIKKAADIVKKMDVMSQRMDGFNDALIMRENALSIPIYYDKMPEDIVDLVKEITKVLDTTLISPRVDNVQSRFIPVRAGFMSILEIRLVDSFGQFKEIELGADKIHPSENLQIDEKRKEIFLRPRFMQPCAIDFKWSQSPVFGVIIPNFLDRNLQVYDCFGKLVGFVQKSGQGAVWMKFFPSNIDIDDIKSPHLKLFVNRLIGENSALDELLYYLDQAYTKAAPLKNEQFIQECFGKPLVLARADFKILAKGYNPHVQWFKKEFACNGFDTEKFDVRFGDVRKINDGLMGFFVGGLDEKTYNNFFVPEILDKSDLEYIVQQNTIKTSLSDAYTEMTVMFDPLGHITVSTGFLPTRKIYLEPEYYSSLLEESEMVLKTAPLLSSLDNLQMPVPAGMTDEWIYTYVLKDKGMADIDKINPPDLLPPPTKNQILEGYIYTKLKE